MASSLFSFGDVKNHPRRSGFDLSRRICFSSKTGELLPVYWRFCYPGDKFKIRHQSFTRTQPVNTAAYVRIREYYDWYFVPLRLINKNFPAALMQLQNNPVQASGLTSNQSVPVEFPWSPIFGQGSGVKNLSSLLFLYAYNGYVDGSSYSPILNLFGFNTGSLAGKLLMYLRYGNFLDPVIDDKSRSLGLTNGVGDASSLDLRAAKSVAVNLLPLFTYQKIYADFFRFTQWENNEPFTYNCDWYTSGNFFASITNPTLIRNYLLGNNIFTLRYANWNKDQFMGVMPNSQIGDVSIVNVNNSTVASNLLPIVATPDGSFEVPEPIKWPTEITPDAPPATGPKYAIQINGSPTAPLPYYLAADMSNIASAFNILQLRMAESVQRYKEIQQCSDQTARDQIYAHFGVKLSPALSDVCRYLGGSSSNIDISEVVNTNLANKVDQEAEIAGKGVGSGQGSVSLSTDEYGILMCIYHNVPLLDYVISGQWRELLYTAIQDVPLPEFDNIGMESINFGQFTNKKGDADKLFESTMGYLPRFYSLKTDYDEVYGSFRSTMSPWVAPLDPSRQAKWFENAVPQSEDSWRLNYGFFKVNPRLLDSIFYVQADDTLDTDPFLTAFYLDIKAVRNFDYDGMPY